MRNLQEQVKKHSVTKTCSDLSHFELTVLVISKSLKVFLDHQIFFLTVGYNNFDNKIPMAQNTYGTKHLWHKIPLLTFDNRNLSVLKMVTGI